nr:uncharacterized protein LOC127485687 isoform X1 [Oryctolagus cuniculus]
MAVTTLGLWIVISEGIWINSNEINSQQNGVQLNLNGFFFIIRIVTSCCTLASGHRQQTLEAIPFAKWSMPSLGPSSIKEVLVAILMFYCSISMAKVLLDNKVWRITGSRSISEIVTSSNSTALENFHEHVFPFATNAMF